MTLIGYETFQPKDAHSQTPLCRIRMLRLSTHVAEEYGFWLNKDLYFRLFMRLSWSCTLMQIVWHVPGLTLSV